MDAIQVAAFSAQATARLAEPATVVREQTQEQTTRVETAARSDGLGAGLGTESARARQAAGQEAAASHEANSSGHQPPNDSGRGSVVNLLA